MTRILAILVILLALALPVSAQVVFDANASAPCASGFSTSLDCSTLTISTGSNRAITCLVFWDRAISSPTLTWDNGGSNQALAQVSTASNSVRADVWAVVAPVSGAKTLHMTWTTSAFAEVNCTSWTAVDQTGGTTSFPHGNSATGSSAAPAVTITSATNNAVIAGHALANTVTINSVDHTQLFIDNTGIPVAGNYAAGASSLTLAASLAASSSWASVGTDILAIGGAAPCPHTLLTLGVGCH